MQLKIDLSDWRQSLPHSYFHQSKIQIHSTQLEKIKQAVRLFWQLAQSEPYQTTRLGHPAQHSLNAPIMAYDFHLSALEGIHLIEINTNAAGFLMLLSQENFIPSDCLDSFPFQSKENIFEAVTDFFLKSSPHSKSLNIAICDENLTQQFYYPEFLVLKDLLEQKKHSVHFVEPSQLKVNDQKVLADSIPLDYIYWRHTDFLLNNFPKLHQAYQNNWTQIEPGPEIFLLLSDKQNLTLWNEKFFSQQGLSASQAKALQEVLLETQPVTPETRQNLWENRKQYVFKPTQKYAGKGVYLGKSLTQNKWKEIQGQNYIAQTYSPPFIHSANSDSHQTVKIDFRAYAHQDELLLLVARGYQGQITNFQSDQSGFYPVQVI